MNLKKVRLFEKFFLDKNLHKTYFILGLTITIVLSLLMPFFNEPDGQYHLAVSGRISNNIIDTSYYGEYNIDSGMRRQSTSYRDGTRFEKYYLNKANFVDGNHLPREINYSKHNFVFWGHLVPAVGLFLGKFVYPSMGVMITVARLFSSFVSITLVALIIRYVKKGKLIYFAIFLSPVVLNSFASLSYDSTGYIVFGAFLSLLINLLVDKSLTKNRSIALIGLILLVIVACKQNYLLFLLLVIPVLLQVNNPKLMGYNQKLSHLFQGLKSKKLFWLCLTFLSLAIVYVLTARHGGVLAVLRRYVMTFGYNYAGINILSNDITSWLASPYPSQNFIPTWVSSVWYLMVFLVWFSEEKFVKSKNMGFLFLASFFVGILGVFFIMLEYRGAPTSYIEGVQGRYFTVTLLLVQVFASSIPARLNEAGRKVVPYALTGLVIVSNALLLFDTVISLIMRRN
ncbi:TPA: DUF2142 domain-containing protein [Streptococcus agalactiae]